MRIEDYVPERFGPDKVKILVQFKPCAACQHPCCPDLGQGYDNPFPKYYQANFREQIAKAGIRLIGRYNSSEDPVCKECVDAGATTHECYLCRKQKKSNEIKQSFGCLSPHSLCEECYETVPAKKWDETVKELEENHKYDWG